MASGPYETVLERLDDLDARLAGLDVGYSEENATAARELVADLERCFESEPEEFVALREAVDTLVDTEDSSYADTAKQHADELKRQIEAEVDGE